MARQFEKQIFSINWRTLPESFPLKLAAGTLVLIELRAREALPKAVHSRGALEEVLALCAAARKAAIEGRAGHCAIMMYQLGIAAGMAGLADVAVWGIDAHMGRTKPRKGRMPQLDAWLSKIVQKRPNETAAALWAMLPEGDDFGSLYRDGEAVVEVDAAGRERSITFEGFRARVTKARRDANN